VFGRCKKSGFTLIEIMVVILIIGLLATIAPPLFRGMRPAAERETFITQLNGLTKSALVDALKTGKIHGITFFIEKKRVELGGYAGKRNLPPTQKTLSNAVIKIPKQLEIKNFYVEGKDELARYGAKVSKEIWFFVFPQGFSQAVIINMYDTKDKIGGRRNRPIGLVLNPFSVQFEVYNEFKKP